MAAIKTSENVGILGGPPGSWTSMPWYQKKNVPRKRPTRLTISTSHRWGLVWFGLLVWGLVGLDIWDPRKWKGLGFSMGVCTSILHARPQYTSIYYLYSTSKGLRAWRPPTTGGIFFQFLKVWHAECRFRSVGFLRKKKFWTCLRRKRRSTPGITQKYILCMHICLWCWI